MILVLGACAFVRALLGNSAAVSLENIVLRHQLAVPVLNFFSERALSAPE